MKHAATLPDARGSAGLELLAGRLNGLAGRLAGDLRRLEEELALLYRVPGPNGNPAQDDPARSAARHLLDSGGKRVRPFLCLMAARIHPPADPVEVAAPLARAAELLHAATLLHDDVIDEGDHRRGRIAARIAHGNAASVIGGDLLLVEALEVVRARRDEDLLDSFLGVLREMVDAEAIQLVRRGRVDTDPLAWERVATGKTASLFGWACEAGGRAAGSRAVEVSELRAFGRELGLAFQLVDDLLDLAGDPAETGKGALADLKQGTLGHPAVLAAQRVPALAARLVSAAAGARDDGLGAALLDAAQRTGALDETRAAARARSSAARKHLDALPPSPAREALGAIADELAERAR